MPGAKEQNIRRDPRIVRVVIRIKPLRVVGYVAD